MMLWLELHQEALPKQGLWHHSHTDWRSNFWDIS